MSQAKVDYHKEQKKNRNKIIKREKRIRRLEQIGAGVLGVLVVAWVGFSIYNYSGETVTTTELPTYTVNTDAIDTYMMNLVYDY